MTYLLIKTFHIVFFTSWFAGLFYLPRIFVNLALVEDASTYRHLLLMARKLYRFITPLMLITIGLGVWMLIMNTALLSMGWMQVKLFLVATLVGYHLQCGRYLNTFTANQSTKGHIYYRWFNEYPVTILVLIVLLAVTKLF